MRSILRLLITASIATLCHIPEGEAQNFAIRDATVMTAGPQGTIEHATIIVRDGHIAAVGASLPVPADLEVHTATGKIVTPGLIATGALIGMFDLPAEIEDIYNNSLTLSAAADVRYAFNPSSHYVGEARIEGVTSAILTPLVQVNGKQQGAGLIIAGQAAAFDMTGTWDSLLRPSVAMVADLSEAATQHAGGRSSTLPLLKAVLAEARRYRSDPSPHNRTAPDPFGLTDADLTALVPVVEARMPILVRVKRASDILNVLEVAKEQGVRIILEGANEAWRVAPRIAAAHIPVLLREDENNPTNYDMLSTSYENAARLERAGVSVMIEPELSRTFIPTRSPRFLAGRAIAHGMTTAGALAAVTVNPARAFGLERQLGSIEVGKRADLVIWTGDPFETSTFAEAVYIRGVLQPMTSRQTDLRDRYLPAAKAHQHVTSQ